MTKDISPDFLRKLLRCDPDTGKLFWLDRNPELFRGVRSSSVCAQWNKRHSGMEAMTSVNGSGYYHGAVIGKKVQAHRVVWAICYGAWPNGQIDHINGDKLDNRINNLRDVTNRENSRNKPMYMTNKSGFCGVSWQKQRGKWQAYVGSDGGQKYLGRFDRKCDAIASVKAAREELSYHQNHGAAK